MHSLLHYQGKCLSSPVTSYGQVVQGIGPGQLILYPDLTLIDTEKWEIWALDCRLLHVILVSSYMGSILTLTKVGSLRRGEGESSIYHLTP